MTDPTLPQSARRFATLLDREYCVWMPSPSVALLAALTTGKGRPKRLLVQENAPAFIANIGLIIGASTVKVSPQDNDEVLTGVLRAEGLRVEQVWAIATHRDGTLSPTDWLSRCAAQGIPTIELCLGSLFALVQWSPFPATFTIVDLDAEEAFAGARLAALLTSDPAVAARVQELCLPAPGAREYIFDVMPRGIEQDERALAGLVEHLITLDGEKPLPTGPAPWSSRLAEADRDSLALAASLKKVDELQRTVDQWEARFQEAEDESARDAEIFARTRTELARQKSESERVAASMLSEKEALTRKLLHTERERDLAVADAAHRDESKRGTLGELKERLAQYEKAAAAGADREARQAAAEEASRAPLLARIARLEADAAAAERARVDLAKQGAEAEQMLASMRAEREALAGKLQGLEAQLGEALKDSAKSVASQRDALEEQVQRAARLEKDVATLAAREAARLREWGVSRAGFSEQLSALEAERDALRSKLSALDREREGAIKDAAKREEVERLAAAEQGQRAERLEKEISARKESEARLTAELAASRAALSEAVSRVEADAALARKAEAEKLAARLEADRALVDKARAELLAQKEESERRRALLQSEKDALNRKVAEVESERDRARVDARKSGVALQAALEEQRQRDERKKKADAVEGADQATQTRAWESERAGMSERIAQLEASMVEKEQAHAGSVSRMSADAERAVASIRAEAGEVARKLAEVEKDRDLVRMEAGRSEEAQRAALEEQRRRADQLEKDALVQSERETRLTRESALLQAELSERVARMEASAVAGERARADLIAQKAEGDLALESIRAEKEALSARLQAMEQDHAAASLALDAEKRRAAQVDGRSLDLAEREAKLTSEWEASRAEWTERLRRAEDAALVARNANASLVARKNEADQARASLQAELEEQMRLAQALKMEGAAVAAREAKKVEASEALRAELEARITRLEGAELIADKARTELLTRKRDSDRALAAAQAERAALLKKLAIVENERDQARALGARPEAGKEGRDAGPTSINQTPTRAAPAVPAQPRSAGSGRSTGGLSALVSLWNTAVIRRPGWSKESEESPAEPSAQAALDVAALLDAGPPPGGTPPVSEAEAPPKADRPAPSLPAPARKEENRAPSAKPTEAGRERTTGGLSALVNLWNTAATMRPFRRKEAEANPPDAPVEPVLGMEIIPDEAKPSASAPIQAGQGLPKSDRPAPGVRARPNAPPRRPEAKPAAPDETEKLGGWLRGLAGRVRGKPK